MNILIDYRPLQFHYAGHGVGVFLKNVLARVPQYADDLRLIYAGEGHMPGESIRVNRPAYRSWVWEQLLWPIDCMHARAKVLHSTISLGMIRDFALPYVQVCPVIATVFDLNMLKIPSLQVHSRTWSFRFQKRAIKRAKAVITISNYVKKDIVTLLRVAPERVHVVPCGIDDDFKREWLNYCSSETPPLERRYILGMGQTENKNIPRLITAYERLVAMGYEGDLRIVGSLDLVSGSIQDRISSSKLAERISFTQRVTHRALVRLYAQCDLFAFPSLCEGFGLPVLEAMLCGAPVVTSNTTSLPEAGLDAAQYCNPESVDEIVVAIQKVLNDSSHRKVMIDKGKSVAQKASWDEAARTLTKLYRHACSKNH